MVCVSYSLTVQEGLVFFFSSSASSIALTSTNRGFLFTLDANQKRLKEKREPRDTRTTLTCGPYLGVDSVLPLLLTGQHRAHLEHAVCGRQHPHVQLEELLRTVVVGQNRDVHPACVAASTLSLRPAAHGSLRDANTLRPAGGAVVKVTQGRRP
ncbi:hypothetical protein EYF80_036349 [Liparis tanakae]|uniref:Uncharacterized protein n=1 Tax=Liparis tanakae TaxID=230148 RepID=A0A4Z2GJH9_9TELE|nr:hypothetical protein EYF80_036349 [Liparis tanakae]